MKGGRLAPVTRVCPLLFSAAHRVARDSVTMPREARHFKTEPRGNGDRRVPSVDGRIRLRY
jgi:hypothetical protein